jgi:SAM-dependent methyltransferase
MQDVPEKSSLPTPVAEDVFWNELQPGFRFSSAEIGSPEFFAEVEEHRYRLEPHLPEIVKFDDWSANDVLEAGCGIGTDGVRFARAGARWVGVDLSANALALARQRFALEALSGDFVEASLLDLPFPDARFDLIYSHGVIHHIHETQRCVDEFRRVLRPGGTALVMVYHRNSFNYRFNIMIMRRGLAALLLIPGGIRAVARITREDPDLLRAHRSLLSLYGLHYLTDRGLFLSNNTDGPGNPLSKAFSREEATALFREFDDVSTDVRYLNLRIYPGGARLAQTAIGQRLERKVGWYLYVKAKKPD